MRRCLVDASKSAKTKKRQGGWKVPLFTWRCNGGPQLVLLIPTLLENIEAEAWYL